MGGDGGGRAVVSTRNTVSAIAGTGSPLVVSRFAARWSTRLRGLPPSATDKLLSTLAPRSGCGLRDDSLRGGELGSMAVDADKYCRVSTQANREQERDGATRVEKT